jgi:hypothetical protein
MGSDILETEQMFDYGEVTIMSIINILFWAFLVLAALLIYGLFTQYRQAERQAVIELRQIRQPADIRPDRQNRLIESDLPSSSYLTDFLPVGQTDTAVDHSELNFLWTSAVCPPPTRLDQEIRRHGCA